MYRTLTKHDIIVFKVYCFALPMETLWAWNANAVIFHFLKFESVLYTTEYRHNINPYTCKSFVSNTNCIHANSDLFACLSRKYADWVCLCGNGNEQIKNAIYCSCLLHIQHRRPGTQTQTHTHKRTHRSWNITVATKVKTLCRIA